MEKIKVKFVDGSENYGKDIVLKWLESNKKEYCVSDEPDYVIYGPHGYECLDYPNSIKIFFTCEDITPDFNICDYAVGFDDIVFDDRYLKYPFFLEYRDDIELLRNRSSEENINQKLHKNTKFCSFVVSNGKGDKRREEFFKYLSTYKKVDSGGGYLNNIGHKIENKLEFDKNHKFSITFENASHKGYTTEKILQGFSAGLIPIYYGDPCVSKYFNKNAFIDISDYKNWDEVLKRIIEIDNDDKLYTEMLEQPVFNESFDIDAYYNELNGFLGYIFSQPLEKAKRTSREFWNKMYNERLLKMRKFRDIWFGIKRIIKIK